MGRCHRLWPKNIQIKTIRGNLEHTGHETLRVAAHPLLYSVCKSWINLDKIKVFTGGIRCYHLTFKRFGKLVSKYLDIFHIVGCFHLIRLVISYDV